MKQKLGRTSFLALFSLCPDATKPLLWPFANDSCYCNSFGFGYSFQHHSSSLVYTYGKQPLFNMLFSFHSSGNIFACSVHIPLWSCSTCCRGLVHPHSDHSLPTHEACSGCTHHLTPSVIYHTPFIFCCRPWGDRGHLRS